MAAMPVREKPAKPYPGFPLTAHPRGHWCKLVKGRTYYFGPWDDWQHALAVWEARCADIIAGTVPPGRVTLTDSPVNGMATGFTVAELVDHFLTARKRAMQEGGLSPRTFAEYLEVGTRITRYFGPMRPVAAIQPADFTGLREALAQGKNGRIGIERLGKLIIIARLFFNYGANHRLHAPVVFGSEFSKPRADALRRAKAKRGREAERRKLFTSEEVRNLLDLADDQMRTMILLALNGGLGNTAVALMPREVVDWNKGLIDYERPKDGLDRRFPLWPETVQALKVVMARKRERVRAGCENKVFLTRCGNLWASFDKRAAETKQENSKGPLSREFRRLMVAAKCYRTRRSFYSLRHTFRTVADDVPDPGAIEMIMGHEDPSNTKTHYVEARDLSRLVRVVQHVRAWLWPRCPWPRQPETDPAVMD